MTYTTKTQRAIKAYGESACRDAWDAHAIRGEGASTIAFQGPITIKTTRQANAAIDAGREIAEVEKVAAKIAQAKTLRPAFDRPTWAIAADPVRCALLDANGEQMAEGYGALESDACVNALCAFGMTFDTAFEIYTEVLRNAKPEPTAKERRVLHELLCHLQAGLSYADAAKLATKGGMDMDYARLEELHAAHVASLPKAQDDGETVTYWVRTNDQLKALHLSFYTLTKLANVLNCVDPQQVLEHRLSHPAFAHHGWQGKLTLDKLGNFVSFA